MMSRRRFFSAAVAALTGSALAIGSAVPKDRLVLSHRGRTVLLRDPGSVFMLRSCDPSDFEYAPSILVPEVL